jgi:uncharacterized protein
MNSFEPAWWLQNAHAQTIWAAKVRRAPQLRFQAERVELSDGDFVDLAWTADGGGPIAFIFHGLGGSAQSPYVRGISAALSARGWTAVVMHFRGCSGEPNRLQRSYHAGDTGDISHVIKLICARYPMRQFAAVGYSLGGNALLNWLAEDRRNSLSAAVAVSVPYDLAASADTLDSGFAKLYQRHLVSSLLRSLRARSSSYQRQAIDLRGVNTGSNFWYFDDKITAPLHGFRDVHEYYRLCSSKQFLASIDTPTLLLHAIDDPFVSAQSIPTKRELSRAVELEVSARGGHVGFIAERETMPTPHYWLEQRIPAYLDQRIRQ